jgi:hypothetical protein
MAAKPKRPLETVDQVSAAEILVHKVYHDGVEGLDLGDAVGDPDAERNETFR